MRNHPAAERRSVLSPPLKARAAAGSSRCFVFFLSCLISAWTIPGAAADPKDLKSADLFDVTKVWTVHLKFTPEQWEAMEPKGGGGFFGGGGRGGRGGFGPGNFLAPAFLGQGDQNKDGKISKEEFDVLGEKWFTAWDKDKAGKLNGD